MNMVESGASSSDRLLTVQNSQSQVPEIETGVKPCLRFCVANLFWCCLEPERYSTGKSDIILRNEDESSNYGTIRPKVLEGIKRKMEVDRAFIIAEHCSFGYLLLTSFKKKKGKHHQLPGGHIDDEDKSPADAAARELFEETGIDIRNSLFRLSEVKLNEKKSLKGRVYFYLSLNDNDRVGTVAPSSGEDFALKLSSEHIGYCFEKNRDKAADMLYLHSGGKSKTAMATYDKIIPE